MPSFKNKLLFNVRVQTLRDGTIVHGSPFTVGPGKDHSFSSKSAPKSGDVIRVLATVSNSLVAELPFEGGSVTIDASHMYEPADLPDPDFSDSGQIYTVGQGKDNGHIILREIWWFLTDQSVSLAPEEEQSWVVSYHEGVQNSVTELATVSSELGTSVSGGWGPISASISASLSASSSVQETVFLTEETTMSEQRTITNSHKNKDMNVRVFQVAERYRILKGSKTTHELSSFVNSTNKLRVITELTPVLQG